MILDETRSIRRLLSAAGALLFVTVSVVHAETSDPVRLGGHFTSSGVFLPTHVDTNFDGFGAAVVLEETQGALTVARPGGRWPDQKIGMVKKSTMVEYRLTNPNTDCFRVNDDDFSVEENAYMGPLFKLVDPIRMEPVASNPSLVPNRSENWTVYYHLETGELLFAKIREFEICIENVPKDVAPWPLCHVRSRQEIIGGTGRFTNASGEVRVTAIAPTSTSNGPAFADNGMLNMVFPPTGVFLWGPSYGANDMTIELPDGLEPRE